MGLFETVQLELFELMGYKKPKQEGPHSPKTNKMPIKRALKGMLRDHSFDDYSCPVELIRKKNLRGLRFKISAKAELEISANKSSSEKEILSLIAPHKEWIEKQVLEARKRLSRFPQKKWQTGETFAWNGADIDLVFSPSSTKKPHIRFMENSFEYFFPIKWQELESNDFQEKLHSNFLYFFKLKASETLGTKVDFWSKQMGLYPKSVSYRNQKTRWGSCSSDGRVNLNWKLASFDADVQDYVIIHELAHLKHQDHSKKFWNLVEIYAPNRKKTSKRLQETAFNADPFASTSELYKNNPDFA
jgi:predicted metal-dependent hydrolase